MSPRTSPALQAWTDLNDRQQGTLESIYDIDQQTESARRRAAARGDWDRRPASEWRSIDFAHEPSNRELFGVTDLQMRLAGRGWDNQGNGSTMAALAARRLITRSSRPTFFGLMHTVALTREGRAAARVGTTLSTGRAKKPGLSKRAWEVLATLWMVDLRGERLAWGNSPTIERVLIGKHIPPLAQESSRGGYEITDRGRDFYRVQYAVHVAAYPDVRAPHPDGAEPWPRQADEILAAHQALYYALVGAWRKTGDMQQAAGKEASSQPPKLTPGLPAAAGTRLVGLHELWQETARQRVEHAAELAADLHERAGRAARIYAATALGGFNAVVTRSDPLAVLALPDLDVDVWDEPRLVPPAETGIHAIDAQAKKLHATAVGRPPRRRGPAPTKPKVGRTTRLRWDWEGPARSTTAAGIDLAAFADYLVGHLRDGALLRRLHGGDAAAPRAR